jgi:hypothetical protein
VAPELLKVMPTKLNEHYLTKDTLRKIKGFEHLTDEEAEAICEFTKTYASIIYESYLEKQKKESDESGAK